MLIKRKNFSLFGLFGKKEWDYNNDPEVLRKREEEGRKELQKTIERHLSDCKGHYDTQKLLKSSKEYEKEYNFKFKPDWYKFLQISSNFFRKNATTWYKTIEGCNEPYNFAWYLDIEDSDCNLIEVIPSPGYIGMEEDDGILSTECLLSFGTDPNYFVNFLPEENKYTYYLKKYNNLSDIFKEFDLVESFKHRNNNGNSEPYKNNSDIYKIHLKIVEEYARALKQLH